MLRNNNPKKWLFIISFLLLSGGFVIGYWEVSLLGILVAGGAGMPLAAVGLGLLLDIAYGAPTGLAQYLFFPFTIAGLISIALRWLALRFMLTRSTQETL